MDFRENVIIKLTKNKLIDEFMSEKNPGDYSEVNQDGRVYRTKEELHHEKLLPNIVYSLSEDSLKERNLPCVKRIKFAINPRLLKLY